MREGSNARAGFDGHAGGEDHIGLDHRIAADDRVVREMDGLGGDERHAILKRLCPHPRLKPRFGGHKLCTGVDAECLGLVASDNPRRKAAGAGKANNVGEIVFARGIGVSDGVYQ